MFAVVCRLLLLTVLPSSWTYSASAHALGRESCRYVVPVAHVLPSHILRLDCVCTAMSRATKGSVCTLLLCTDAPGWDAYNYRCAALQVELAQTQYQLPRLTRMWTHLDRVAGGGQVKGVGEKQIEIDKRLLRDKAAALRR